MTDPSNIRFHTKVYLMFMDFPQKKNIRKTHAHSTTRSAKSIE